jgi:hypothetical protein
MKRDRFEHLCLEAEAGRDAFIRHPDSNEEGLVTSCLMQTGHMVVKTTNRQTRCWDFKDCEDQLHPKTGPMI